MPPVYEANLKPSVIVLPKVSCVISGIVGIDLFSTEKSSR